MATYKWIATASLSSNTSTIGFTSIPGTYKHLILKLAGKTNISGDGDGVRLTINGTDINGNGYGVRLFSSGNTSSWSGGSNLNAVYVGGNGSGTLATMFSHAEYLFPNYTSSAIKSIISDSASEKNGSTALNMHAIYQHNTTSPITSISIGNFDSGGSTFMAGTTAYLYGI
jgi:hypothetical protein